MSSAVTPRARVSAILTTPAAGEDALSEDARELAGPLVELLVVDERGWKDVELGDLPPIKAIHRQAEARALADRVGAPTVVALGGVLLLVATAVSGTAGPSASVQLGSGSCSSGWGGPAA